MHAPHHARLLLPMLFIALPCASYAEDLRTAQASEQATPAAAVAPAAMPDHADGIGAALDTAALEHFRGGSEALTTYASNMNVDGTVSNSTAVDIASGTNAIAGGAFTNAAGIPTVIQNSGSNVLIQNALIVNLQFK
jgi:hypothetical protein